MSSKINRLLQLRKNSNLNNYFHALDEKYPQYNLGANTPILNHQLQTENNFQNVPATLFFSEKASAGLDYIRHLAQKKSTYRLDKDKDDSPLEFFCLGYQDFDGDIIVESIEFPAYSFARINSSTTAEINNKLFNNKTDDYTKIEGFSAYFDYLRNASFKRKNPQGNKPVAFYGTTRPLIKCSDNTENCIRMGELAKSIVPGDIDFGDIMTGVISVSPYTIIQTKDGLKYKEGSLEAILTNYKSNKKGQLTPANLTSITNCMSISKDKPAKIIEIANSQQPYWDFPKITSENTKCK